jgi:hypothetical protein
VRIFTRTIGIDYSGAETPTTSLKGLRVYMADGDRPPVEIPPPSSPRKYWTRKGIAEWLVERLAEGVPTLVGTAQPSRSLPGGVETEMREHFMAKLGQVRVAAVAGIWPGVYDFGPDVCRALAQHDDPPCEEQRLFHIMRDQ